MEMTSKEGMYDIITSYICTGAFPRIAQLYSIKIILFLLQYESAGNSVTLCIKAGIQ